MASNAENVSISWRHHVNTVYHDMETFAHPSSFSEESTGSLPTKRSVMWAVDDLFDVSLNKLVKIKFPVICDGLIPNGTSLITHD